MSAPPDQAHRTAAELERTRNVVIDAGAGTGKTTLIVRRLVELLAPRDPAHAPLAIDRVLATTFTRRAAGELKLRLRERLLAELGRTDQPHPARRAALEAALGGLDVAYVGTIHSLADRLLRLRPIQARLSPAYELVEDESLLVAETTEVLLRTAQEGTLAQALAGTGLEGDADEASRTIVDALHLGIKAHSRIWNFATFNGLDALVEGFVRHRDRPPRLPLAQPFDLAAFRALSREIREWCKPATGPSPGERRLAEAARALAAVEDMDDPLVLGAEVLDLFRRARNWKFKKDEFGGNDAAYKGWKALNGDTTKKPVRATAAREDLCDVFGEWLGRRLVRLQPIVLALYGRVKVRHGVLDQLDLLLELRTLLRDDLGSRGYYQGLFDHLVVDEFQDTDPLQAEVLVFLCEHAPKAATWRDVDLTPGKLTIVGDPKQSIYRFRRADIAMYDEVRAKLATGPHLEVALAANFRSRGTLLGWLNARFDQVLGASPDGRLFDRASGVVYHQPLAIPIPEPATPRVHVLPLDAGPDANDGDLRAVEGEALAHYLRWLVDVERLPVRDGLTGKERPVTFGDIAILAVSTYSLDHLLPALDALGVPHATRGGKLFLADPLVRSFLLGLRALADRDDGVAHAALLRPPFFALDPLDLLRHRAVQSDALASDERSLRATEALSLVQELRRERDARGPGATARELLERTALGRIVALGPNGAQRLARLREVCHLLERRAAEEGLDYDAATEAMRAWADDPIGLDPPAPVGADAVQVTTVHQAKGLEYPVVILWDGRGKWDTRPDQGAWFVEGDGRAYGVHLDGLDWEYPTAGGIALRDTQLGNAERRRVLYVAATRARDLLVLPRSGDPDARVMMWSLLDDGGSAVRTLAPYVVDKGAPWAKGIKAPVVPALKYDAVLETQLAADMARALEAAARATARPTAISTLEPPRDESTDRPRIRRPSRFGPAFGTAVHEAIGLALRRPELSSAVAVRVAGVLDDHAAEAARDVDRALAALTTLGLRELPRQALRLEYPLAHPGPDGTLLTGFIDLVAVTATESYVLDFKTDTPPADGDTIPAYEAQVRTYARVLLEAGVVATPPRCGLLFTADGVVRWCP